MMLRPNNDGLLDVVINNGILKETGFETLALTSLLLNRRADPEDKLPYSYDIRNGNLQPDRQGWIGDVIDEQGRLVGSKLWLLDQELATSETHDRAIQYIEEALQHFIDDGHAHNISIFSKWSGHNRLNLQVDIHLTSDNVLSLRVNYETGAVYVL